MNNDVFPQTYDEWKYCITQKCGIPLTMNFVRERINALSVESSEERKKFVERYGVDWTNQVIDYFKQALNDKTA